jgi:hypothetical protein
MASCCKFYNEILVYRKGKEFFDASNDLHLHKDRVRKIMVNVNFTLQQVTKAQSGSRDVLLLFFYPWC